MSEVMNLQDAILKEVRRDKVPVTLFLMNGFQLRGTVSGYDNFVVVLESIHQKERHRNLLPAHLLQNGVLQIHYLGHKYSFLLCIGLFLYDPGIPIS